MLTSNEQIFLVIIILVIIYFSFKINDLEKKLIEDFATDTTETQINSAVKKIYLADVEAIRLLSNFAIQLSQGGTTIPGKVNFTGKIGVVGRDGDDLPENWIGGLRTQDIYADGTIGVGTDKNTMNVSLHNNGVMRAGRGLGLGGDNAGIFLGRRSDDSTIDGASKDGNNVEIRSWHGIGLKDTNMNKTNIWFNVREGTINCKGINIVDDNYNVVTTLNNISGGNIFLGGSVNASGKINLGSWNIVGGTNDFSINNKTDRAMQINNERTVLFDKHGGVINNATDVVCKSKRYAFLSGRGGYISDQDNKGRPTTTKHWESFKIDELNF